MPGQPHDAECPAQDDEDFPEGCEPRDVFIVEGAQERYGSRGRGRCAGSQAPPRGRALNQDRERGPDSFLAAQHDLASWLGVGAFRADPETPFEACLRWARKGSVESFARAPGARGSTKRSSLARQLLAKAALRRAPED